MGRPDLQQQLAGDRSWHRLLAGLRAAQPAGPRVEPGHRGAVLRALAARRRVRPGPGRDPTAGPRRWGRRRPARGVGRRPGAGRCLGRPGLPRHGHPRAGAAHRGHPGRAAGRHPARRAPGSARAAPVVGVIGLAALVWAAFTLDGRDPAVYRGLLLAVSAAGLSPSSAPARPAAGPSGGRWAGDLSASSGCGATGSTSPTGRSSWPCSRAATSGRGPPRPWSPPSRWPWPA